MRTYVVIDTNVLISAYLSPTGNAMIFLEMVYDGRYTACVSESILREYERVLRREKFKIQDEIIEWILSWFMENAVMIEVNENEFVPEMDTKDASDKIFYLAAKATHIAHGTLLVTGNVKHYPVEEWRTMLWELV